MNPQQNTRNGIDALQISYQSEFPILPSSRTPDIKKHNALEVKIVLLIENNLTGGVHSHKNALNLK